MELAVISDVWFIFDQDKNEGLIPGRPSPPELNRSQYFSFLEKNSARKSGRNFITVNFYEINKKFSSKRRI